MVSMKRVFPAALCAIALGMTASVTVASAQASELDAESALSTLTVVPQHNVAGYNRMEFAYGTVDTDHDGCRTRDDVLARDLDNVEKRGCTVESGTLHDPYTGGTIAFVRGRQTSSAVQIDHIVALHDAWNDGASTWSKQQLESFGNDQFNLAAVDGPANQQKGDQSADKWEPSNTVAQCPYVAQQIAVKRKYSLGVTASERNAMKRVLNTCEGYPLPSEGTSLVRAVIAWGGSQPSGHPFVDTGTISSNNQRYEFRGMNDVLRQDMAAFLYRWAGSPDYAPSESDMHMFTDVSWSTPHAKEIWWLAHEGISVGWTEPNGSRTFRGTDSVKRQDMAAFMHKLAGVYGPTSGAGVTFADVTPATPHYADILWLAKTGVSSGWKESDGRVTFRGMDPVKRQDMAAFLYRLAGKPASPESSNTWIYHRYVDVNESTPHCHDIYWLTLKGISEGWVYTPPQPPATPSKPSQPSQPAKPSQPSRPAKPSQPSNPPATVYYKNCTEVRKAGKAPLHRGDPGYRSALDRDGDGIACETKR